MKKFFHNAFAELHHVVWPTKKETRKYFSIVAGVITVAAIIFFIFGSLVTSGLFAVRGIVTPPHPYVAPETTNAAAEKLLKKLRSSSGATSSGMNVEVTSTGVSSK